MQLSDFDYDLPDELIARYPLDNRTDSRLLHLGADGSLYDRQFRDIVALFQAGDVVVLNDTKVMQARLKGKRASGGQVEVLVERMQNETQAYCHIKASNAPKAGTTLLLGRDELVATVIGRKDNLFIVEFSQAILPVLEQYGELPIPPYFNRDADTVDNTRYQTVFHDPQKVASVAAPTASLHFDEAILAQLKDKGVQIHFVTLHVGAGTFLPVRVDHISEHVMHAEWGEVPQSTVDAIIAAKKNRHRVIAVGTTATRALESAALAHDGELRAWSGDTQIFIYPGFEFRVIDCLLTNFHLPQSTLLMLVSALSTQARIMAAYRHAIAQHYRFFSYGDAMLIEHAHSR